MVRAIRGHKKVMAVLVAVCLLYLYGVYGLYAASRTAEYAQAVAAQSATTMEIYQGRGTIYDCNLQPLTNEKKQLLGVAIPVPNAIVQLQGLLGINLETAVQRGAPIIFEAEKKVDTAYIDYFTVPMRYSADTLSPNLLGYIDGTGNGVTGVESAFNAHLTNAGQITLRYATDALGRIIVGEKRQYDNTLSKGATGIALTLDKDIQLVAEKAAKAIKKGAIVVLSVPDGKLRASVSIPDYDTQNLQQALNDPAAPMINRAFTAFAPGSVFKLVVAAAALEGNVDSRESYTCVGTVVVGGMQVSCYGGKGHGAVNLHTALQKSCNCYFIRLANRLQPQALSATALNLGFGTTTTLYEGLVGESGHIPEAKTLLVDRAIANFAIGQGDVLVTPLQVAALMNTIVSQGTYKTPSIYEGAVTANGKIQPEPAGMGGVPALEAPVALRLKSYMESAAKYGTARSGAPENGITGAKTGTAQTGVVINGQELLHYWYAGFVGRGKTPEYVIVVLSESAGPDENSTPAVFKELGTFLNAEKSSK